MKPLSKTASKIFNHILSLMDSEDYIKIDNAPGSFMYVSFERLYGTDFLGQQATVFAMAHYYEQNGDLIPDPDMTFLQLVNQPEIIYPTSITTSLGFKQSIWNQDGTWKINKKEQADEAVFASMWLKNIREQQKLKP